MRRRSWVRSALSIVLVVAACVDAHVAGALGTQCAGWVVQVMVVAFLVGIVATGVLHLFLRFVPRPTVFFFWLAFLAMIASLLAPLSLHVTNTAKIWLCAMHVVVGLVIISLLEATASRVRVEGPTTVDPMDTTRAL